jgi:hypothetical protein
VRCTDDWVFGGYTPIAWGSRNGWGADPDLKSFLFTLTNPHGIPPQAFPLEKAENAIFDHSSYGPTFGSGIDLRVADSANGGNNNSSNLGVAYENNTGFEGNTVFTGRPNFTAKEVEVFEVLE